LGYPSGAAQNFVIFSGPRTGGILPCSNQSFPAPINPSLLQSILPCSNQSFPAPINPSLLQSILSVLLPLCPPSFLLPSPLLLSYPLVTPPFCCCCCCPHCTRSPCCCCCCRVQCLCLHQLMVLLGYFRGAGGGPGGGGRSGGGPGGVSLITGSDQKRYLNQSRVNPAGLKKNIYIYIKRYRTHPAGQKTICMRGDIGKVRYPTFIPHAYSCLSEA